MSEMLLTAYNGAILGPIAKLTWLDNEWHVYFNGKVGISNVGLSIILFTIVIYALMFPLTYKQQKFSKLSQKMNPELQAVQKSIRIRKIPYPCRICRLRHSRSMRSMVFHRQAAVCRC